MPRRSRDDLREDYLHWLEAQLTDEYSKSTKSYWELVMLMFEKKFDWSMDMDNNRVQDGKDLRMEFARANGGSNRQQLATADVLMGMAPVSFLEVLIGLSRRMAFIAGGGAPGWAWQLLGNLELQRMSDPLSRGKYKRAEEIMNAVMLRTYLPDGTGGFFPLAWPDGDQTQIELWYQMNSYVEELHPEH